MIRAGATSDALQTSLNRPPDSADRPESLSGGELRIASPLTADSISVGDPSVQLARYSAPNHAASDPVSRMSTFEKVQHTVSAGIGIAAKDGAGKVAKALSDPKTVALVGAGAAAAIGVQFIPVAGEAVDVVAGVAGVAMYAAAGPEHRARITQALGELKQYLHGVASATTQPELDAAAKHFAKFLEIGGSEAADGLLTVAGAAAAPAKFAGMLAKVKELGGLSGIARLGPAGLAKLGSVVDSAKSLGRESVALAGRSWDAVSGAIKAAPESLSRAGSAVWHAAGRGVDALENGATRIAGKVAGHIEQGAADLERGWDDFWNGAAPQTATAGGPARIPNRPVERPQVAEMRATPNSGSSGTLRRRPSAADTREIGKASAAQGVAPSALIPAERRLADGTRVARGVDGTEKPIVELHSFDDYKNVAKGNPEPNRIYRYDGKSYETDALRRPVSSSGRLRIGGGSQRIAGTDTEIGNSSHVTGDVGFHHGGDQFGFGGGKLNLSPGNGNLNGGEYKKFEGYLRRQADAGHDVSANFKAVFTRSNGTNRPNGYVVQYSIDNGPVQERAFFNPRR